MNANQRIAWSLLFARALVAVARAAELPTPLWETYGGGCAAMGLFTIERC